MDILNLIKGQLSDGVVDQLSKQIGGSKSSTTNAIDLALPTLVNALTQKGGATAGSQNAIMDFIDANNDGSVLDDLMGYVSSGNDTNGGGNIVNALLGNNKTAVQNAISKKTGLNAQAVTNLLTQLSPVVVSMLAQQKQQGKLDLNALIATFTGGGQKGGGALASLVDLLDQDNDGNPMDDVMGMIGKFMKKK